MGTTHDPVARAPAFRQLLEYPALVHIGRVRDFSPPELWRGRSDSDDGSGQSGLPDSSRARSSAVIGWFSLGRVV